MLQNLHDPSMRQSHTWLYGGFSLSLHLVLVSAGSECAMQQLIGELVAIWQDTPHIDIHIQSSASVLPLCSRLTCLLRFDATAGKSVLLKVVLARALCTNKH